MIMSAWATKKKKKKKTQQLSKGHLLGPEGKGP